MARPHSVARSRWLAGRLLAGCALLGLSTQGGVALARGKGKPAAKPAPAAKGAGKGAAKADAAPAKKAPPPVTPEHKKALAELMGAFKFGLSKDEVVALLTKQIEERYADKIKGTSDVYAQDNLRKEKRAEIQRITSTYVAFEGKKTGWDVSLIEDEFAHHTGEAMLVYWENQNGKNQRRFFFFFEGKLYKMFLSLDTAMLPADKKNFETFRGVMEQKYGAGDVEPGLITWTADEFVVRAIDKLRSYDALCLVIADAARLPALEALRKEKAPPKQETSSIIKAVIDENGTDHPDVKAHSNAVDEVIKAQK